MSNPFVELLGPVISTKNGDSPTEEVLLKGGVVGLYFSAHWCGPCRGFTPELVKSYNALKESGKDFEIVFVSSDRDQASFDSYYGEMPWLSLPFTDRDRKNALSKKFKVKGIPTLVLLDGSTGATLSTDGREVISSDPTGADFPWTPKSLDELLGDEFRGPDGALVPRSELAGKSLALYFSAHWCPPCRGFTPKLAAVYKAMKDSGRTDFEFIFVSSDNDEAAFNEYHGEMPWLALPYARRKEKELLSSRFGVNGIPTLVTIDAEGAVVNRNARPSASSDPTGVAFPWPPAPFAELSETVESNGFDINEKTALVVLYDGCSAAVQEASKAVLVSVAGDYVVASKAKGTEVDIIFFTASESSGPVERVKELCKLGESEDPVLLLLDIPDNGGFYTTTAKDLTAASIEKFLADYSSKALSRSQLGQ